MHSARVEAIEDLYRSEYGRFVRTASAIAGSREHAADAVHDAFVSAVRNQGRLPEGEALKAWLWRTVVNAAKDVRTRETRRTTHSANGHGTDLGSSGAGELLGMRLLVGALPERQRLTLFLRYYADLDYAAIGAVLGVAPGTVAATLNAAHTSLRAKLEREVTQR
jgi:RNA polymerase sigma-70 factor (ECF subfamily)